MSARNMIPGVRKLIRTLRETDENKWCKANRDGECDHKICPQIKDGEPNATGRHCPLDTGWARVA